MLISMTLTPLHGHNGLAERGKHQRWIISKIKHARLMSVSRDLGFESIYDYAVTTLFCLFGGGGGPGDVLSLDSFYSDAIIALSTWPMQATVVSMDTAYRGYGKLGLWLKRLVPCSVSDPGVTLSEPKSCHMILKLVTHSDLLPGIHWSKASASSGGYDWSTSCCFQWSEWSWSYPFWTPASRAVWSCS